MAGLFLIEQLAQNVLQDLHPAKCSQSGSNLNSRALSMTAVELLSNALDEAERFLVAQKDLDCYSQVLEQQCAAMLRNCQMLPQLTGQQAAELINKVKDKIGKLANISPIVLAISGKVVASIEGKKGQRPKQTLTNFGAYVTQRDVAMLGNPHASNYTKLDHIAVRMVRIGLDVPNEVTAGHVLKLLGCKPH